MRKSKNKTNTGRAAALPLVLVGAGEFGRIALEYFRRDTRHRVVAFSAERAHIKEDRVDGLPVVPFEKIARLYPPDRHCIFVAITHRDLNQARARLYHKSKKSGYALASYVSPKAAVSESSQMGENCFIYENSGIQPGVRLGHNVICGAGTQLAHGCRIEDNVFMASSVCVGGNSTIGQYCFIGLNATIADRITVASDCIIAAGAVVLSDTQKNSVYKGNPAVSAGVSSKDLVKMKLGFI